MGAGRVMDDESASDRRRGRGKSTREVSPDLTHPNQFAELAEEGDVNSGVPLL